MPRNVSLTWDPAVGAAVPAVRQIKSWYAKDDFAGIGEITLTVLAGSSLVVWATDMNTHGDPPGSGVPNPVYVTDSQVDDGYTSHGYILSQYDWQDQHLYTRKNVSAGSITVTGDWNTTQWHALCVAEIVNVGIDPTITAQGAFNRGPLLGTSTTPTGADTITTGTVALGSSPAFLVGLAQNGTDMLGSEGYPAAGTGFSTSNLLGDDPTVWNWTGHEGTSYNNIALVQSRYVLNPGTIAATWTPRAPGLADENFMAWMVAFQ
jgi:hypothetical protein